VDLFAQVRYNSVHDPSLLALLEEHNTLDQELYEYAKLVYADNLRQINARFWEKINRKQAGNRHVLARAATHDSGCVRRGGIIPGCGGEFAAKTRKVQFFAWADGNVLFHFS